MKKPIAIHSRNCPFSDRWVELCRQLRVPVKLVDCYNGDIIHEIKGCSALLWRWDLNNPSAHIVALDVLRCAEELGLTVYPNTRTCWHYDDKIAQKYLLESIGAPLIPTWIFLEKRRALDWVENAEMPKVMKLRRGAGSRNVWLVTSKSQARRFIRRAFTMGFNPQPAYFGDVSAKLRQIRSLRVGMEKAKRFPSVFLESTLKVLKGVNEKGYVYFQEYVPANSYDTRITIIGNRAFGFRRFNRVNDFRASGSGNVDHDPKNIDMECVHMAFEVSSKMKAQTLAFDFLRRDGRHPEICEISYAFVAQAIYDCPGHWNKRLEWIEGQKHPQDVILQDLLRLIGSRQ
jgi:glutathione synthase/RimK-type ligase-like ATP-grasp enzyme